MRTFCLLSFVAIPICIAVHIHTADDLDDNDRLDEDQFREAFNLRKISDPVEKAIRSARLAKTEEEVKDQNEDFINGESSWYARIYETADQDPEQIRRERTGGKDDFDRKASNRGTGGRMSPEHEQYDEESNRYIEMITNRRSAPRSYDSRKKGYVSDVRPSQGRCGSCVAFATIATAEVCIKKASGNFGDFAEQQLVDCGYRKNGCDGCDGASYEGYARFITKNNINLTHESNLPYKGMESTYQCPRYLEPYNVGARVTDMVYKYKSNEETLKQMVYEHGAVIAAMNVPSAFDDYGGGIFNHCWSETPQHAVTVVGYTDSYWIIKNSWGKDWGENGYMKLKKGVNMCGIGNIIVGLKCSRVPGPTSAPLTTAKPCFDKVNNCQQIAINANNCYGKQDECMKSCGLCEGMTPHKSVKCYDKFNNCNQLCYSSHKPVCKASCGCSDKEANCWDYYNNCRQNYDYACRAYPDKCKKTCGRC